MNQIKYGSQSVVYALQRVPRKTVGITIKPDSTVHVRAPLSADDAAIARIVRKRASWILRQQRFFEQFQPRTTPREYVGGETHLYLGRRYRLRLQKAEENHVALWKGYIHVSVPDPEQADHVRICLNEWYLQRAQDVFPDSLTRCRKAAQFRNHVEPPLRIRKMSLRWGSCSPAGIITINVSLIRASKACIDYVMTHELCHLIHPNHSVDFYRLLDIAMPDWPDRKLRLERQLS